MAPAFAIPRQRTAPPGYPASYLSHSRAPRWARSHSSESNLHLAEEMIIAWRQVPAVKWDISQLNCQSGALSEPHCVGTRAVAQETDTFDEYFMPVVLDLPSKPFQRFTINIWRYFDPLCHELCKQNSFPRTLFEFPGLVFWIYCASTSQNYHSWRYHRTHETVDDEMSAELCPSACRKLNHTSWQEWRLQSSFLLDRYSCTAEQNCCHLLKRKDKPLYWLVQVICCVAMATDLFLPANRRLISKCPTYKNNIFAASVYTRRRYSVW